MARAAAREAAFRLVFVDLVGGDGDLESLGEMVEQKLNADDLLYVQDVIKGCQSQATELDEAIAKYARGWELDRLARTDLALLRLAVYEIYHREDIPASVSINEAVSLAHVYCGDESSAFLNGILGTLAREAGKA